VIIFEPSQIKSATGNIGDFSSESESVVEQPESAYSPEPGIDKPESFGYINDKDLKTVFGSLGKAKYAYKEISNQLDLFENYQPKRLPDRPQSAVRYPEEIGQPKETTVKGTWETHKRIDFAIFAKLKNKNKPHV
jgi:hypothetical protein